MSSKSKNTPALFVEYDSTGQRSITRSVRVAETILSRKDNIRQRVHRIPHRPPPLPSCRMTPSSPGNARTLGDREQVSESPVLSVGKFKINATAGRVLPVENFLSNRWTDDGHPSPPPEEGQKGMKLGLKSREITTVLFCNGRARAE